MRARSGRPRSKWRRRRCAPRESTEAGLRRSASPISAKPPSSGTAARASRSATPSSGRTGGPRAPARNCAGPVSRSACARRPDCVWTRTSRPPRSPGSSSTSPARASGRRPESWPSARSTRGWRSGSPAGGCTSPTPPTPAARCCTTSTRGTGMTSCSTCSAFPARCFPTYGGRAPSTARSPGSKRWPAYRWRASPATSRRRSWGSSAPSAARSRPRTAPAASRCSTPGRLRSRPSGGC